MQQIDAKRRLKIDFKNGVNLNSMVFVVYSRLPSIETLTLNDFYRNPIECGHGALILEGALSDCNL